MYIVHCTLYKDSKMYKEMKILIWTIVEPLWLKIFICHFNVYLFFCCWGNQPNTVDTGHISSHSPSQKRGSIDKQYSKMWKARGLRLLLSNILYSCFSTAPFIRSTIFNLQCTVYVALCLLLLLLLLQAAHHFYSCSAAAFMLLLLLQWSAKLLLLLLRAALAAPLPGLPLAAPLLQLLLLLLLLLATDHGQDNSL